MPRGTSRQVKPRPKHSKGKHHHAHTTRQTKLGGTRSHRLHMARTAPLPHLQSAACHCPCNAQTVAVQVTRTIVVSQTVLPQNEPHAIATGVVAFTH